MPLPTMNGQQRLADYYRQQAGQGVGFTQARNQALFNAQTQAPGYGQQTLTPFNQTGATYQGPMGPGGGNATGQGMSVAPNQVMSQFGGQTGGATRSSRPTAAPPNPMQSPLGSTIQTGIQVQPAIPQGWMQQATSRLRNYSPQAPTPGTADRLLELINFQTDPMALNLQRQGQYDNAQHLLSAQQARSQAGLGWGGIQAGDELNSLHRGTSVLNAIINMMMSGINAIPG